MKREANADQKDLPQVVNTASGAMSALYALQPLVTVKIDAKSQAPGRTAQTVPQADTQPKGMYPAERHVPSSQGGLEKGI
ncbi:hypothetical protein [Actinobaculum suis]|uniref:hypothetical protein n=1 Tax=Actinobaculum suis TaxID=1657 RepID=UPI0008087CF7|nr:hypothetical protein [Actinobaculum suis]OCA95676.1 hypothetical protein ACU20_00465 [Actinobaculum suis]OCA95877.1 hypothetical protein ACU21_00460 [Actinobaculum suis]